MAKKISFYVLIGIVIAFAVLAYRLMADFFVPLFLSVVLVILFWPLHLRLVKLCKGRQRVAAALTTTAVLLIVLLPAIGIMTLAAAEGLAMVSHADKDLFKGQLTKLRRSLGVETPYIQDLRKIESEFQALKNQDVNANPEMIVAAVNKLIGRIDRLERDLEQPGWNAPQIELSPLRSALKGLRDAAPGSLDYDTALQTATQEFLDFRLALLGGPYRAWLKELGNPTDSQLAEVFDQSRSAVSGSLLKLTGQTGAVLGKAILGLVIIMTALFFFFADGPALNQAVMRAIPLDENYKVELLAEFDRTSRAVVMATLLAAVAQGLLAGVGFFLVDLIFSTDLRSIFLLTLLATVCALIPFVGASVVWFPVSLYLFFVEGNTWAAIALLIYGFAIISTVDNVIKPWVLHGQSKLHPLLALLSVLGGVQAFGPIGILVGPMAVVFLQTLLKILRRELGAMEKLAASDSS